MWSSYRGEDLWIMRKYQNIRIYRVYFEYCIKKISLPNKHVELNETQNIFRCEPEHALSVSSPYVFILNLRVVQYLYFITGGGGHWKPTGQMGRPRPCNVRTWPRTLLVSTFLSHKSFLTGLRIDNKCVGIWIAVGYVPIIRLPTRQSVVCLVLCNCCRYLFAARLFSKMCARTIAFSKPARKILRKIACRFSYRGGPNAENVPLVSTLDSQRQFYTAHVRRGTWQLLWLAVKK